ncbi:MAG: SusC/RagA family TonB-linked outer membrane protein [Bacteroidia bacterium]|nr:SusC/RagA family TonB-linked outer membrane protein [Bacteroidia bacterium]
MKSKLKTTRLFALLFTLFFSLVLSAQPLTKVFKNETLKNVLKDIESQTGLSVIYRNSDLNENKRITASFDDVSLSEVMNTILDNDLEYSIQSNILVISKKGAKPVSIEKTQQGKTIRGKIVDTSGEPIIGASVTVAGTSKGTVTDYDGNYVLEGISDSDVISVSYIGYVSQEFPATSPSLSNMVLKEDTKLLDEVVVIGYGSTRKDDLSMAVSTLKIDDKLKSRPASLSSIMQGEIPGVTLQMNTGDPMAIEPNNINIRGRGSRGNDRVLYVVDGVPDAPFNVADIESVTVLKDAASAAIYGAAVGSGGVIMITTRRAQEDKLSVNASVYTGFKQVSGLPEVLTAEQFNQVNKDAFLFANKTMPDIFNPAEYPYGNVTRTDWMKEIFRTAPTQHYSLSIAGGSKNMKSYISASYDKEDGVMLNTFSNRLGLKADISFQLTKWLNISQRGTYEYSNGQGDVGTYSHESVLMSAIFYPRSATIYEYDENGKQLFNEFGNPVFGGTIPAYLAQQGKSGYGEIRNPVATLLRLRQHRPRNRFYSTSSLEIKPIRNLSIKSDFTAGLDLLRYEDFRPRILELGRPNADNSRAIRNSYNSRWLWETIANYSHIFNDKHYLSAMLGYTMGYENYRYNETTVKKFDREDPNFTIFNTGKDYTTQPKEEIWDESMFSVLGRLSYSFDDRYFLTASIRRDASSKLWRENNYGYFPAFSGAWKISSEPFFTDLKKSINLLKIRGSWGEIGNNKLLPRYPFNVAMEQAGYENYYGNNLQTEVIGSYMSTVVNRNLRWESTEQTGLGIDVGLLNNRFEFTVDYYNKTTKNLIEKITISQTVGKPEEPYGNVGKVSNKGWEFSGKYNQTFNKVSVGLFANLSTVKSEVLDLGKRKEIIHSEYHVNNVITPLYSRVGQPWFSYYLLQTDGVFQTQEEVDNYLHTNPETGAKNIIQPGARPGDFKFVDFNKDGKINDEDRQFMGNYLPKITYGFGGSIAAYGFDFSIFLQGVSGVKVFNGWKQMALSGRGGYPGYNFTSDILKSWNYNKDSGYPVFGFVQRSTSAGEPNPQNNLSAPSDFFLEDGSYLRLRNVTLGYTLPKTLMSAMHIPTASLRFYISGENLKTFTKYSGISPEVGNHGVDTGTYPISSVWNFGLHFNF